MVREVLLLGNPKLYDISRAVKEDELDRLAEVVNDLHDTLMDFKKRYGAGRAIAAPQIGVMKRLIYMFIDKPVVFINPDLLNKSTEMMTVWDDCLCFPDLLVKVERHRTCTISYRDRDWAEQEMLLEGDFSELLQHEYDHLDGILAVSRAMNEQSFALCSQKTFLNYHMPDRLTLPEGP
jgi:peptide deformylase